MSILISFVSIFVIPWIYKKDLFFINIGTKNGWCVCVCICMFFRLSLCIYRFRICSITIW